jgi:uncharacterized membrane protein
MPRGFFAVGFFLACHATRFLARASRDKQIFLTLKRAFMACAFCNNLARLLKVVIQCCLKNNEKQAN